MRITLIGSSGLTPKATTSRRALPLARALAAAGHSVTLLVPGYDDPAAAGRTFDDGGVQVRSFGAQAGMGALVGQLTHAARESRPDAIHVFKPTGPSGAAAWLLAGTAPVTVDYDDLEGLEGWAGANRLPWLEGWALDAQERAAPRGPFRATAASRFLVERLVREGARGIAYLPNCAESSWVDRKPATKRSQTVLRSRLRVDSRPVALFVGHVPTKRDLAPAVAAFDCLAATGADFQWLVIADGPGLEPALSAAGPALKERIVRAGRVPSDDLWTTLAFAHCSIAATEDTPINRAKCAMKVVDSLAAGVPVVATDVGQHREYVVHGETGVLAMPDNPAALAAGLDALLRSRPLAERMGAAARERMARLYRWEHWIDACIACYSTGAGSVV